MYNTNLYLVEATVRTYNTWVEPNTWEVTQERRLVWSHHAEVAKDLFKKSFPSKDGVKYAFLNMVVVSPINSPDFISPSYDYWP